MRPLIVAAALFAVPALAAEKECAAVNADGTPIHAVKYQSGKLDECRNAVKAEMAKQCKPGDKKVKFQFRVDTAEKPRETFVNCGEAAKPAEAKPAEPAKP